MPQLNINESLCHQCGICSSVCPTRVIKGKEGETPHMRENFDEGCITCGQCMAFCPYGACAVAPLPADEVLPIQRKLFPTFESTAMLFKSRRSIRLYKDQPVPKDDLRALLDVARFAPSAKNAQPLRWKVIYDHSHFKAIGDALAAWFTDISTDKSSPYHASAGLLAASWKRGGDPFFRGAPHIIIALAPKSWEWAAVDAAIALTYLELAAHSLGLGCCWGGYLTQGAAVYAPLQETLGLAPDEKVAGAQMIGYPALRPAAIPPRNPLQVEWVE